MKGENPSYFFTVFIFNWVFEFVYFTGECTFSITFKELVSLETYAYESFVYF